MSIRIETLTSKTASDYKYSKNQTIGATEAGVDIGADQQGGSGESIIDDTTASTETTYSSSKIEELIAAIPSGGRGITNSTVAPHISTGIQTTVTATKED